MTKPTALVLAPEAPYPLTGGGSQRTASLLEYLAARFDVHAIFFRQPGDPDPARAVPPGKLAHAAVIDLPYHSTSKLARYSRNVSRYVRNAPPLMDRFAGFPGDIGRAIGNGQYDLAILEHFWIAPYAQLIRPHARRLILDLHNIESTWYDSVASASGPFEAIALRRFATASVALERKWLPMFDAILVTSELDAALVRSAAPKARTVVYPNALQPIPVPQRSEADEIAFSGNLEYAPNIGAVRFFADRIWPTLREGWPSVQWRIVGKNSQAVAHLVQGDSRISLTGPIDDPIAELSRARVAVVPLLAGSGTRVKIIEAWAAGTPVVSTSIGAAGLDARNGEHLLIADQPEQFADAVSRLLASEAERALIGAAGRNLYEQRYTWPVAWQSLENILGNANGLEKV